MTRYVLGYSGTLPYIGDVILVRWGLRYLVHEVVASKVLLSLFRERFRYWVACQRLDIGNKVDSYLFNMAEPTATLGVAAKLLKILVFGATGRTGKEVVKQALEKGHHVTAVVRTPEKVDIQWVNYLAADCHLMALKVSYQTQMIPPPFPRLAVEEKVSSIH